MGSQIDLGFSQRPGWKDKGNFSSVSHAGVYLARSSTGPSQCLKRVKVTAAGDPTLPHRMWLCPDAAVSEVSCVLFANLV